VKKKPQTAPVVKYLAWPSEDGFFYFDSRFPKACILFSRHHPRGEPYPADGVDARRLKSITAKKASGIRARFDAEYDPLGKDPPDAVVFDALRYAVARAAHPITDRDRALAFGPATDRSPRLAMQRDIEEFKPLAEEFLAAYHAAWASARAGAPACDSIQELRRLTLLAIRIGERMNQMQWRQVQGDALRGKISTMGSRRGVQLHKQSASEKGQTKADEIRGELLKVHGFTDGMKLKSALKIISDRHKGQRGYCVRNLQQCLLNHPPADAADPAP